jgi:hypothetical protein
MTMRRMLYCLPFCLFSMLLLHTDGASAQIDTIGKDNHSLLTGQLRPGCKQYLIYMQDPKELKKLFFWYWLRYVDVQTVRGENCFVITQHWFGADSSTYREVHSLNRVADFSPVFHSETAHGKINAYNWDKDQIRGADTVAGNTKSSFQLAFSTPNFNWNLDVETFEMLPLAAGKAFAIPFYDAGLDTPRYVLYTVRGEENLETFDHQHIDCWKLVTEGQDKSVHYTETYWISQRNHEFLKEEDHYGTVFRLKIKMPLSAPDLLQKFN